MDAIKDQPAFEEWIEIATRGLPPKTRAKARAELSAHYLDAVETHRAANIPEYEAQLLALVELGDARATAAGLRSAHISVRRLVFAMATSLVYAMLIGALSLSQGLLSDVALYLLLDAGLVFTGLVVLNTFQRLPQAHSPRLEKPLLAMQASLALGIGGRLVYMLVYGHPLAEPISYYFQPATAWPEALFFLTFLGCQLLIGLAMLWLCWRLRDPADSLFGMRLPLQIVLAVMGAAGVGLAAALVANASLWVEWASLLGNGGMVILLMLMALLFYRMACRPAAPRAFPLNQ